jgi:hypothetical protein
VSELIFTRCNEARIFPAPNLPLDMLVQRLKQPVNLREQIPVIEGQRNKKKRKRDMLPPQLAEHIAHRERHCRKKVPLVQPQFLFRCPPPSSAALYRHENKKSPFSRHSIIIPEGFGFSHESITNPDSFPACPDR